MESTTYAVTHPSITGTHAAPTHYSPNVYGQISGTTKCGITINDMWFVTDPRKVTCEECK